MRSTTQIHLPAIWSALVHRAAALAGAGAGLLALLAGAPVTVACLRGGLTWAAAVVVGLGARGLITWAAAFDLSGAPRERQAEENSTLKASEASSR